MRKETETNKSEFGGKAVKNAARVVLAAGMTLSACTPGIVKTIETPSAGEAMPIGLLDTDAIGRLPEGDVKNSFYAELNDAKQDCAEIFGCMGYTVQIYRVITSDNVYSYRFANVEDARGPHTMVLSVMDGKAQESTDIREDLVAMDTKIDKDPAKVFGYVDDQGNSHYLLINIETDGGDRFVVFDAQGNPYNVVTQNEKEVQAYSHIWQEPSIVQAEALPNTNQTPQTVITPTIEASTAMPTETTVPTSEENGPASTEWQVSPDGHIVYNESQLYEGMFTINKEHPEYVEKYWEELVRGLWNLNFIGENEAFLSQFPTDDSLVEHFRNGGEPVSNILIPSIYQNSDRIFNYDAELVPTNGPVDLSQIAISIYKPTREEIYKYSPSYSSGTKYISYLAAAGSVWVQEKEFNGRNILSMTFRKDLLMESRWVFCTDYDCSGKEVVYIPAFEDGASSDQNLLAATQMLRLWAYEMLIRETSDALAYQKNYDPPVLAFGSYSPLYEDILKATTLDGTPLALR